jgi:hypothetical protein
LSKFFVVYTPVNCVTIITMSNQPNVHLLYFNFTQYLLHVSSFKVSSSGRQLSKYKHYCIIYFHVCVIWWVVHMRLHSGASSFMDKKVVKFYREGKKKFLGRNLFLYYFSTTNVLDQICHPTRNSAQSCKLLTVWATAWLVLTATNVTTKRIYVLHILRIRTDYFPKEPSTFGLGFGIFCVIRTKYFYTIETKSFMEVLNIISVQD